MNTNLIKQLAEYGRQQRVERRPVDMAEILAGADPTRRSRVAVVDMRVEPDERLAGERDDTTVFDLTQPREGTVASGPNRWIGVVTAAAAAILVVVGVFVVTDGNRGDAVTDSVPSYEWSRAHAGEVVFGGAGGQWMSGVTAGGPGFVAVGRDFSDNDLDAAVWISVDGVTWSRVPHDEAVFGGFFAQGMLSVTAGGPGLVGVGRDFSGGNSAAAVWISVDGVTWSRVPHDEAVFGGGGDASMEGVAVGGPGLVAVGIDILDGDPIAAVWTSVDGITWSRAPHDNAAFGGINPLMSSVTTGGPGLVAVGTDILDGDPIAAVWTSVDGITWSRAPHDNAAFGGINPVMSSVTASGPGLVAVGSDGLGDGSDHEQPAGPSGDSDAAVWTSVDGIIWSRVPHDDAAFGPRNQMASVTAGRTGLVAVGSDWSGDMIDAAVWTSVDGMVWSRAPHDDEVFGGPGEQRIDAVTAGVLGLVAVGTDILDDDLDAAVWTSVDETTWSRVPRDETVFEESGAQVIHAVSTGGPGVVGVGSSGEAGDLDAAVWTSVDSVTWSRIPHDETVFGGEGVQVMNSVSAGGPGLVAVGADASGRDFDAAVWTSVDGITWSRIPHDETVFGGAGHQTINGVTTTGAGLVAVGSGGSGGDLDAAVWTSTDGITWSRAPHDEAVFGGPGVQRMNSVTTTGAGLVAVGSGGSGGDLDAAVWTSTDGITWSRAPHDEAVFGGPGVQRMNSVTTTGAGLVAVGSGGSGGDLDAAVWTSTDGITWSRAPHDEAVFGGPGVQRMNSVTTTGAGLVAVGYFEQGSFNINAAVWTSADGIIWSRVPREEAALRSAGIQVMNSVTAVGPGLVVVGRVGPVGDFADAAVWLATPES